MNAYLRRVALVLRFLGVRLRAMLAPSPRGAALPQWNATPATCNPGQVQSYTGNDIQLAMGDGSVRTVNSGVSLTSWQFAVLPDDGQVLGDDF